MGILSQWYEIVRRSTLLTVGPLALVCGLVVLLDVPELIPAFAIPCLAQYSWRTCRISEIGTILAVVTLELVTAIVSIVYHSHWSIFDPLLAYFLFLAAVGCMLASILTFLGSAYKSCVQRRQNLLAALTACLLPVLWLGVGTRGAAILSEWELQREIARSGLPEFIAEINAVVQRLGRAPKDEAELVRLLGKPMPKISWGQIDYRPTGGKQFALGFGYDMGCYEFDSQQPERGWHIYGSKEHAAHAAQ
ncbi:MAG: hypothetical protein ACLP9L_01760 [Thermoguttaceae bacterium]